MGMTSDQNENISFKEQEEMRKRDEAKKAALAKIPCFTPLGTITIDGKEWQLFVGEDKKWYKAKWLGAERRDEMNRTAMVDKFSEEKVPVTKEEFDSYFKH